MDSGLTFAALGTYFGRRNFATIAGISLIFVDLVDGAGVARSLTFVLHGIGGYTLPLAITALIGAAGSLAFLCLGNPRSYTWQRQRAEMEGFAA